MVRIVKPSRIGRRPIRSDSAPIIGSQNRFEIATQNVTTSESVIESFSTLLPKVGV